MKKKVVIIGGGVMQLPVIKQAREMNLESYVVDGNPACIGFDYINSTRKDDDHLLYKIVADISNEEEVLAKVKKKFNDKGKPDGVLTVGTDYIRTVSKLGEHFQVKVLPYEISSYLTNKYLMRTKLTEAGFFQPDFRLATNTEEFIECLEYFSKKSDEIIIKPVDSMGARGVKLLTLDMPSNHEDYLVAFHNASQYSKENSVIVEEKIIGQEFSLDAIVFGNEQGSIQVTGIADRIIECSPFFVETGHIIPSQADPKVVSFLKDGFKAAIKSLVDSKPTFGAFKGDVFYTNDGKLVIGEIAGRLSGGYMSGYTYPLSSGVNLMEAVINIALGKNPFPLVEQQKGVVIEKALLSNPGKVVSICGTQQIKESPGVHDFFLHIKHGDIIKNPENNLMKSANVIVRGKDFSQAQEYVEHALSQIQIVTTTV